MSEFQRHNEMLRFIIETEVAISESGDELNIQEEDKAKPPPGSRGVKVGEREDAVITEIICRGNNLLQVQCSNHNTRHIH